MRQDKLSRITITPETTIADALKKMDDSGEKIIFVVNGGRRLLGTVTDGDIRRWIIKGGVLSEHIDHAMNRHPIALSDGYRDDDAKQLLVTKKIECIPIVDKEKTLVSAVWWIDFFDGKKKQCKQVDAPVVIMAGGEGSRLSPFTKVLPKPLIPIGDKPIAELIIERFREYGCKQFYLSVNYKANLIRAYFSDGNHDFRIDYVQEDRPLGTAGSLELLNGKIASTFYVSNCDILIEADYADIMNFHKDSGNVITLVGSFKHYTIPYGVCEITNGGCLKEIREKPAFDFLVNTGLYILEPEALADIPRNEFYHITDLISDYMRKGRKIGVYPVSEKSWLDMGQLEEMQEMLKKFGIN